MDFIQKTENIPVKGVYDVIVAGSGPAGIAAAVSAARLGAKTLLIESMGSVGGISTTGLMSHFTGRASSRLYSEILKRMADKNYFERGRVKIDIDPEMLKNVYYEMLEEAGAEILLYTMICDAVTEDSVLKGVICQNKGGRVAYMAKVIVDGTGDGDVAYLAGAEYIKGREEDAKMQPATLMFKVGGVDMERAVLPHSFETTVDTPKGELQQLASRLLPHPAGHVLLYRSTIPGIVTCNMTNAIGIDGTNAEDLTRAELTCRSQMVPIVEFLREYAPGYENCYIISAASLIGVRETRHFKGTQTLTKEDILEAREFDNWIVRDAQFNFDVHNITGSGLDKTGVQKNFTQKNGYQIPFGCIIPEKLDGLILSGRNISGTHMAHSSYRAMPICAALGEAGGICAALAAEKNCRPREVPVGEIQKLLK